MACISDVAPAPGSVSGNVSGIVVSLSEGESYSDFAVVPFDGAGEPRAVIPLDLPRNRAVYDRLTGLVEIEIDLTQHADNHANPAGLSLPAAVALVTTHEHRVLDYRTGASIDEAPVSSDGAHKGGLLCFAHGTPIDTPDGPIPVEALSAGDLVSTHDNGPMPIRWIYRRTVTALGDDAPVVFARGAIGNDRPIMLSRRHAVVVPHDDAALLFGSDEVLAEAGDLIDGRNVFLRPGGIMAYFHLMLDDHQLLRSNGALVESFRFTAEAERHLGAHALRQLRDAGFDPAELRARFATPVRPMIPRAGARLLARAA